MFKVIFIVLLSGNLISCATLPKSQILGASIGLGVGAIIGNIVINSSRKQYSSPYSWGSRPPHRSVNQNRRRLVKEDGTITRGNYCYSGPPILRGYGCYKAKSSAINFGFIMGPLLGYYISKKLHFYLKKGEQKDFLIDLHENMIELPQSFNEDLSFLKDIPKKRKKNLAIKKVKLKKAKASPARDNWNTTSFEGLE